MRHVCVCVHSWVLNPFLSFHHQRRLIWSTTSSWMPCVCVCMCYVCFNALLLAWVWTERFHFTNNKTKEVGSETVVVMLNTVQCLTLKECNFDGLAFPKTLVRIISEQRDCTNIAVTTCRLPSRDHILHSHKASATFAVDNLSTKTMKIHDMDRFTLAKSSVSVSHKTRL